MRFYEYEKRHKEKSDCGVVGENGEVIVDIVYDGEVLVESEEVLLGLEVRVYVDIL
nr:hypothetical protein [Paenibacillus bovis]